MSHEDDHNVNEKGVRTEVRILHQLQSHKSCLVTRYHIEYGVTQTTLSVAEIVEC